MPGNIRVAIDGTALVDAMRRLGVSVEEAGRRMTEALGGPERLRFLNAIWTDEDREAFRAPASEALRVELDSYRYSARDLAGEFTPEQVEAARSRMVEQMQARLGTAFRGVAFHPTYRPEPPDEIPQTFFQEGVYNRREGAIIRTRDRPHGKAAPTKGRHPTMTNFDLNRTFGVELEAFGKEPSEVAELVRAVGVNCYAEGYNHVTRTGYWKVVTDASLRGDNGLPTFELVSPPLKGLEGLAEVRKVCKALTSAGIKVNKTCGLHVHHDAKDFSKLVYWQNLVKLYARLEPVLDQMMPESRRANNNGFCNSVAANLTKQFSTGFGTYKTGLQLVEEAEAAEDLMQAFNTFGRQHGRDGRYHKVNLSCWWRQGTIEFRQHSGTVDADKVANWIVYTQLILRKARTERPVKYEAIDLTDKVACQKAADLGVTKWAECEPEVQAALLNVKYRRKHFGFIEGRMSDRNVHERTWELVRRGA